MNKTKIVNGILTVGLFSTATALASTAVKVKFESSRNKGESEVIFNTVGEEITVFGTETEQLKLKLTELSDSKATLVATLPINTSPNSKKPKQATITTSLGQTAKIEERDSTHKQVYWLELEPRDVKSGR